MKTPFIAATVFVLFSQGIGIAFAGPKVTWRQILMTPEPPLVGLLESQEAFVSEIGPPKAIAAEGIPMFTEKLRAVNETFDNPPTAHYFFCTVYYTPKQSGFTEEAGFDTTKKSLGSRRYGMDFYLATRIEGFSRLVNPPKGLPYVSYTGRFHSRILGNRGNVLRDRESVAVHRGNPLFGKASRVWILDPHLYNQFGAIRFQVGDTGGGLYRSQIDLYWGEDEPLGPGPDMWRPASCDVPVSWIVPCLIWK